MSLTQVWGALLILVLCPLLGGLPLIRWITTRLTGRRLDAVGTGNFSVSAAFYHGGTGIGVLAVLSEAVKGIAAVLLARQFFPTGSVWELVALMALVMGRYWIGRGAGTTNVVWGYVVHDWVTSGLILLIGGVSFTLLRERQLGKLGVLVLLPLMTALRHPENGALIGANLVLSALLAWIYQKVPDDLELPASSAQRSSRRMFKFFRGDRALLSLDQPLAAAKVGQKAATLSQLRAWGYPVPIGWVLPAGDDPAPLLDLLNPTPEAPLIVRSSAIGEDSESASAAGQYESLPDITSVPALEQALIRCQLSYNLPAAVRYRQDRNVAEAGMAVLVQVQVQGVFSGVAFSRDPIARQGDAVVIEALPGMASRVVSGQVTPEQYRVWLHEDIQPLLARSASWLLPDDLDLDLEGAGNLPPRLIQQVAYLARQIEARYHGIPQDIEWSYDGQQLWILQSRPITTLLPIWTRKIAAEVIPGFIRPLTWSINRPLTCGVWGEIFAVVLGDRARGLDFNQTATLHHAAAYFNATLLGQLFQRMGLPPESLEFLTRGAKFSKPPLRSTLRNLPGLLRLIGLELRLEKDFEQESGSLFEPGLAELQRQSPDRLPPEALRGRIYQILKLLRRATYYSIMAPLSAALRRSLLRVPETSLDNSHMPEVASVRALRHLADQFRPLLSRLDRPTDQETLFAALAEHPEGQALLAEFDRFLAEYGYLSEVATDIAVPTWKEDPRSVRQLFSQFLLAPAAAGNSSAAPAQSWQTQQVQRRLTLKGRVTAVYSQLLAELRWSIVALERQWLAAARLAEPGDIFFLSFDEIEQAIAAVKLEPGLAERIAIRRAQFEQDQQRTPPVLVYGNEPPLVQVRWIARSAGQPLQGIAASPGQVEGRVLVVRSLQAVPGVDRQTILVVPYTDSGWAPLLAQAGGLIAEVGGQLSHGAIVAREYGIPAVMNIAQATQRFQDGQRVRIDGSQGTVELL